MPYCALFQLGWVKRTDPTYRSQLRLFQLKPTRCPNAQRRRFGPTVHVEVGFEVTTLRGSEGLLVAASRRSNELRLFQCGHQKTSFFGGGEKCWKMLDDDYWLIYILFVDIFWWRLLNQYCLINTDSYNKNCYYCVTRFKKYWNIMFNMF